MEAVKKDEFISDLSDGDKVYSDFDYENYPEEYWETDVYDVTEEDEGLET